MNDRLLTVLEIISSAGPALGPRDIAQRAGLPQATAYRLLSQLQELGLIERVGIGYRIGHRVLRLALGTVSNTDMRDVIESDLKALADATGETSFAARLTANGIELFVSRLPDEGRSGGVVPPTGLRPVVCSAAKAILAHLPDADRSRLVAEANLRFPEFSRSEDGAFRQELAGIVDGSMATCFGEENPDIGSFATPVMIRGRKGLFSVGIVGPRTRIEAHWTDLRDPVEAAAQQIARSLDSVA